MNEKGKPRPATKKSTEGNVDGVTFLIPCYNESPEVLLDTVNKIDASAREVKDLKYEILVVNDGSTRDDYSNLQGSVARLITNQRNMGYGASLMSGVQQAKFEMIGISDADGTYPVDLYPKLLAQRNEYDMVVGSRVWMDIPLVRRPVKFFLTLLASYLSGYRIPDLNSGMRLFKKDVVFNHVRFFPMRFSFTSTLTMICLTNLYSVKFIDIPYSKRIGNSSINPFADTIRFFSLTVRLALYFRPLRFFMPLSGILVLVASARGIRDIVTANHIGNLALVIFFMAFQVFFFGLIAEIINKK